MEEDECREEGEAVGPEFGVMAVVVLENGTGKGESVAIPAQQVVLVPYLLLLE